MRKENLKTGIWVPGVLRIQICTERGLRNGIPVRCDKHKFVGSDGYESVYDSVECLANGDLVRRLCRPQLLTNTASDFNKDLFRTRAPQLIARNGSRSRVPNS